MRKQLKKGRPVSARGVTASHVETPGLGLARVTANLSQTALATSIGATRDAVAKWERCERRAPVAIVERAAKKLRVTVEQLTGR